MTKKLSLSHQTLGKITMVTTETGLLCMVVNFVQRGMTNFSFRLLLMASFVFLLKISFNYGRWVFNLLNCWLMMTYIRVSPDRNDYNLWLLTKAMKVCYWLELVLLQYTIFPCRWNSRYPVATVGEVWGGMILPRLCWTVTWINTYAELLVVGYIFSTV